MKKYLSAITAATLLGGGDDIHKATAQITLVGRGGVPVERQLVRPLIFSDCSRPNHAPDLTAAVSATP